MYQPTASAAMRRHNGQPPNAACVFPPRRTEGLSNRIPFSFVRPALVVLRLLFSVCSPSHQEARACLSPTPGRLPASTPGRIVVRRRAPKSATHQCLSQKEEDRRAAHEQECGPLTNENLEGEGSDGDLPLGVILWESKNTKHIGTGDSLLDNAKGNATLLDLQAVFAAPTLLFSDLSEHFFEKSS